MTSRRIETTYLIFDAAHRTWAVRKRRPNYRFGEFAYRIRVAVPEGWCGVLADVDLPEIPEPPIALDPIVEPLHDDADSHD